MTDKQIIRRLWRDYIWPQKGRLLVAVFFMIILAAATAAYAWLIQFIVNEAIAIDEGKDPMENAQAYALAIVPVVLGLTAASGISMYLQRVLVNAIALNAVGDMQKQMFASAHRRDYAQFASDSTGNLISKFTSDVTAVTNSLIRTLSNLVRDSLTVIFLFATMLTLNWQLTVMILVIYPLAAWPIIEISKRMRGNATDVQAHIGKITSDLKESFTGSRMIKAYGLEASENKRLGHAFDKRIKLYLDLVTNQARVDPILEVMGGLAIAGVFIFGVYQFTIGQTTAGAIAGVLGAIFAASPRIRALGTLSTVVQEGLASTSRIFSVIDEVPTIEDAAHAKPLVDVKGDIEFDDVSLTYADGTEALKGVTLTVEAGKTVALVGASGGGKTTLINLLPRLYDVSAGHITIDGHDIRDVTMESLRANIALVSQHVTLFDDTVAANIGFGDLNASRDDIIAAAKAADAHDFITALPNGYDTILGEDGDSLSGGQRQRVSIARAILRDAPILLLDEATSALDAESEAKVQAALERLSEGRTSLVIAHRLSTIQKADEILVMKDGEIVERGTHDSLSRKTFGIYAQLRALQNG